MKSRARKDGETAKEFLARMERTLKTALSGCRANLDQVAEIYGVDPLFVEDVISRNKRLQKHLKEIRAEVYKSGEEEVVLEPPVVEDEKPAKKLVRRNWPKDSKERAGAVAEALKISLVENEGDLVEVAECLNRPIDEIMDFVDASEELTWYRDRGLRVKALRAENQLYKNLDSGNHQAVKMALNNLDSERWSDRSTISINNSLEPPERDLGPDIVSIVKGVKGA